MFRKNIQRNSVVNAKPFYCFHRTDPGISVWCSFDIFPRLFPHDLHWWITYFSERKHACDFSQENNPSLCHNNQSCHCIARLFIFPHSVFIFLCAHSFHLPFPPFCLLLLVLACYVFGWIYGSLSWLRFLPIQLSIPIQPSVRGSHVVYGMRFGLVSKNDNKTKFPNLRSTPCFGNLRSLWLIRPYQFCDLWAVFQKDFFLLYAWRLSNKPDGSVAFPGVYNDWPCNRVWIHEIVFSRVNVETQ